MHPLTIRLVVTIPQAMRHGKDGDV